MKRIAPAVFLVLALSACASADDIVVTNKNCRLALSENNGGIVGFSHGGKTIFSSGDQGLWQARFLDGKQIDAASYSAASTERTFRWTKGQDDGSVRLQYQSKELAIVVTIKGVKEGIDLSAEIAPRDGVLTEFALPARVRFKPQDLEKLVCPNDGNQAVGTAFFGSFFEPQSQPTEWKPQVIGPKGHDTLFGGPLVMRPDRDEPVEIRLTDEGRKWLGQRGLIQAKATVNRPPRREQADLVLVDSDHGPYFSSRQLGAGRLWRIGGGVGPGEEKLSPSLVVNTLEHLAADPAGRKKIGLLSLASGPRQGSWTTVDVAQWRQQLERLAGRIKIEVVPLDTVESIAKARDGREFLAIVNPYGEWLPVATPGEMPAAVAAIGQYVRRGGNWFEVGGYPLFCELLPAGSFLRYEVNYPPAFADFFHLETHSGDAAIYRVQPRDWAPWCAEGSHHAPRDAERTRHAPRDERTRHAPRDEQDITRSVMSTDITRSVMSTNIFVPGRIACGGDERGGWCDRPFATYVKAGMTWQCPTVRIAGGNTAVGDLLNYARANRIERRLEDKMRPEVLEKFKRSVLVYYGGTAPEKLSHLPRLPVPCQLHFADYLHGGFDKQYPDHLPPSPRFGTPDEFRKFIDAARQRGHLVVPYTNPTWWCDEPKGPSFQQAGEAPLLKRLDGKLSPERYGPNTGFTICHWHPAVQEANRRTRRQFLEEYPVDILFQDQCGARGWAYDLNPASPTPYAYIEGLLSMIDEDSRLVPLSTESGWDRVVNAESQLCGMTWSIVPTEGGPQWRQLMKDRYPPGTWEIFPLAQYIAHDKLAMIHHDLGQFVTNRQTLAWTLGLGYSLSDRIHAPALEDENPRQWLLWLDRVQKSVCSRYVGERLDSFSQLRDEPLDPHCDGVLSASYRNDSLTVIANLDPAPRKEMGVELAGYGFVAKGPDLFAGNLRLANPANAGTPSQVDEGASFVAERHGRTLEVWVYGPAGTETCFVPPGAIAKPIELTLDDRSTVETSVAGGLHRFRLPAHPPGGASNRVKYLWHATADYFGAATPSL